MTSSTLAPTAPSSVAFAPVPLPSPPASLQWHPLGVSAVELRCAVTLTNGQSFGWRKHPRRLEWTGVLGCLVLSLRQLADDTHFAVHHPAAYCEAEVRAALRDFLFLDRARLVDLYAAWSADERFASVGARLPGMRLLRQEPLECLVSFICSSCNNIARITQMTAALRGKYGQWLCDIEIEGQEEEEEGEHSEARGSGAQRPLAHSHSFHAFPTLAQLVAIPSSELRALGFGYRAEYVTGAALQVQQRGGVEWLTAWRSPDVSTEAAVAALQELAGVGPKVAACVALFSLDRLDLIPVDTHVHQIALRDYGGQLSAEVRRSKSVSKKVHASIAQLFRDKFGELAGWAHSVLFTAELPAFKHMLTAATQVKSEEAAAAAAEAAPAAAQDRKRQRGGRLKTEQVPAAEVHQSELPVPVLATTELVRCGEEQSRSRLVCVKVEAEVSVKVEAAGEVTSSRQVVETLQFPVVKRARIPRKTSVIVKRTAQRSPVTVI